MAKVLRTNPDSSKNFFEIFPNFIWESNLNIYYLNKLEVLRKRNSLTLTFANKDWNNSIKHINKITKVFKMYT